MTDDQHKQTRASMLCVIAFTIGTVLAFASGCTSSFRTQSTISTIPPNYETTDEHHFTISN